MNLFFIIYKIAIFPLLKNKSNSFLFREGGGIPFFFNGKFRPYVSLLKSHFICWCCRMWTSTGTQKKRCRRLLITFEQCAVQTAKTGYGWHLGPRCGIHTAVALAFKPTVTSCLKRSTSKSSSWKVDCVTAFSTWRESTSFEGQTLSCRDDLLCDSQDISKASLTPISKEASEIEHLAWSSPRRTLTK